MKIRKKLSALLLGMLMFVCCTLPSLAAGPTECKLIINETEGVTQIQMYQLVTIAESPTSPGTLTYNLNTKYNDVFTELSVTTVKELSEKSISDIIDACETVIDDSITADKTEALDGMTGSKTFTDTLGYYYITMAGDQGTIYNPMFVTVPDNQGTAENPDYIDTIVNVKKNKPEVVKKINDNSQKKDISDAGIGEAVEYSVTADVPKYAENAQDSKIVFQMIDTLSNGLTWVTNQDVKIAKTSGDEIQDAVKNVTVSGQTVTIDFDYSKVKAETQIVVNYQVIVNQNAVIGGAGNENTVKLNYTTDYKTNSTGESDPDSAKVYSYGLDITKAELGNKAIVLSGAEFELTKGSTQYYFTETGTGVYKALNSDIYNVTDAGEGKYTATPKDEYGALSTVNNLVKTVVSDNNGKIQISGLDAGAYTLKETKAPEGYYVIEENITFTITAEELSDSLTGNVQTGGNTGNEAQTADAYYHKTIFNSTQYVLPKTGDLGTGILLFAGLLAISAGIILLCLKIKRAK